MGLTAGLDGEHEVRTIHQNRSWIRRWPAAGTSIVDRTDFGGRQIRATDADGRLVADAVQNCRIATRRPEGQGLAGR